jgi:hypothetical protein
MLHLQVCCLKSCWSHHLQVNIANQEYAKYVENHVPGYLWKVKISDDILLVTQLCVLSDIANIMTESSYSLHKCGRNLECRCLCKGLPEMLTDYYIHLYTHHHELMLSVGSHGSSSLLFVMKLMD